MGGRAGDKRAAEGGALARRATFTGEVARVCRLVEEELGRGRGHVYHTGQEAARDRGGRGVTARRGAGGNQGIAKEAPPREGVGGLEGTSERWER